MMDHTAKLAMEKVIQQIQENIKTFFSLYPAPVSCENKYPPIENVEWTSSFWTGMLHLAWEYSGLACFREAAEAQLADFRRRLDERIAVDTHDLGFLYILSCIVAWRLYGHRGARDTALKAADLLMVRYYEKAGIIQAWGDLNDPAQKGRIIIDCAMNLPLLHWASGETGNPYYKEAAISHINQANRYLIREDFSSFHTFYFDIHTGLPIRGTTAQGFSDNSCWARGQAWGIYGNALSFRYTRDIRQLELARNMALFFLQRLPKDRVPYWDLSFTHGPEERDSSAAAIAVCGLLELASLLPPSDQNHRSFEDAALDILASLAENYAAPLDGSSNGLLLHGVYNKPGGAGVDECCIWGDYFYTEALLRVLRPWHSYW